ncbi:MAG TPA: YbaK/EbsC family protein [candidate division Zixibacteria bacterium]|nr:YbaK/EbsC family protein [candidate division Zixibacteria bacterium]
MNQIRSLLREHQVAFKEVRHQPTYTSEESARARGEDVAIGGKALLMKVDETFHLFVLSAAKKIDSKAIKKHFGAKKIRFATADELKALTGLVPGCVPPFGRPILDFDLYVDNSIFANDKIAFNAGSLTDSIVMSTADYIKTASAQSFKFTD